MGLPSASHLMQNVGGRSAPDNTMDTNRAQLQQPREPETEAILLVAMNNIVIQSVAQCTAGIRHTAIQYAIYMYAHVRASMG